MPSRRVLVVVSNPLGGIRTYLLYNLRFLVQHGYVFTFIAPESAAFESFKHDLKEWPGVKFVDVPVQEYKYSFRKPVRAELKSGGIAIVHSQGLRAGTETAVANFGLRVPHVMTLHDVIVPGNDIPGKAKYVRQLVAGHITKNIDVIVPVSEDCAQNHLEKFPCWRYGKCRIEVIRNGVDVLRLLSQASDSRNGPELRSSLSITNGKVVAGFFGRFMPQKGFLVLLEALKLLASRGYMDKLSLVATRDPHGYCREYTAAVQRDSTLEKMVRFIEPVSDISSVLPLVDFLVMPSLWEAYGLLAAEAMVLGIPIVGSDAIGLREVLHGTPASAPQAGNSIALAAAIQDFVDTPESHSMATFASEAQKRFDIITAVQRLEKVYSSLVD